MLTRQLRKALLKGSYVRNLTLGAVLGVAVVILVLSLFANYRQAVAVHLTGIYPHVSIRKAELTADDLARIEAALGDLGAEVEGFAPAIDLEVEARISQVNSTSVVCAERGEERRCYDFRDRDAMIEWTPRDATAYEIERSRSGPIRLRGLEIDPQGSTLIDVERILDVRRGGDDLKELQRVTQGRLPAMVLFERSFFHRAQPLDDFLVTLAVSETAGRQPMRLLSTFHLGLKGGATPVVITGLEAARQLLGRPGFTNGVDVRLRRPERAPQVAAKLAAHLGPVGMVVSSWRDEDAGAFRLLAILGRVLTLVLASVVLIAALSIASTLSLVIVERRRVIAMLRALGLRDRGIFLAVLSGAARIAALGLAGGVVTGVAASALLLEIPGVGAGLAKLGVQEPGVLLDPLQIAGLVVATLALFVAVAWAPARAACRVEPVAGLTSS